MTYVHCNVFLVSRLNAHSHPVNYIYVMSWAVSARMFHPILQTSNCSTFAASKANPMEHPCVRLTELNIIPLQFAVINKTNHISEVKMRDNEDKQK